MSEAKHTPEPWFLEGEFRQVGCLDKGLCTEWCGSVLEANAKKYRGEVCEFQSATNIDGIKPNEAFANANRIVDCVNALTGIPNPAEFVRAAEANADLMKKAIALLDPCMNESDIRKLRGHFLEALSAFRAAGGGQ
jgi:hypothetical protein